MIKYQMKNSDIRDMLFLEKTGQEMTVLRPGEGLLQYIYISEIS